jgi:hypothetical protein
MKGNEKEKLQSFGYSKQNLMLMKLKGFLFYKNVLPCEYINSRWVDCQGVCVCTRTYQNSE